MFTVSLMTDWDDSADMTASDHAKEQHLMEEITRLNLDLGNAISPEEQEKIHNELEKLEENLEKLKGGEVVTNQLSGYDNEEGDPFSQPSNEKT